MSQIHRREIILSDHIYDEIQLLQKEISIRDGKVWSISSTVNLLLLFCLREECRIGIQNNLFLQDYLHEKKSFLDEFVSRIVISAHLLKIC
ncbi:Hypothetical protein Nlim_1077 [Candidatus Nitrosarchaeum limnium SFB1]|jgi:hypothetical protein|uniref:Uncharacterized protein n=1 Tax=Candidatus Nitrosarchaeum limnium SFB1 TaxID=886738 RepID=F3KKQ3_9ARCH|nr:Hypothetical protein Nlim_1077 [Candidatus Nitrosarchaeum limnium SFB1]